MMYISQWSKQIDLLERMMARQHEDFDAPATRENVEVIATILREFLQSQDAKLNNHRRFDNGNT